MFLMQSSIDYNTLSLLTDRLLFPLKILRNYRVARLKYKRYASKKVIFTMFALYFLIYSLFFKLVLNL